MEAPHVCSRVPHSSQADSMCVIPKFPPKKQADWKETFDDYAKTLFLVRISTDQHPLMS